MRRTRDRDHDVAQDEVPTRSSPEGAKQIAHASQLPIWSAGSQRGPEHPDTATSLAAVGLLLQAQGDLAGQRAILERAYHIELVVNSCGRSGRSVSGDTCTGNSTSRFTANNGH
jgi:hypothetical protein